MLYVPDLFSHDVLERIVVAVQEGNVTFDNACAYLGAAFENGTVVARVLHFVPLCADVNVHDGSCIMRARGTVYAAPAEFKAHQVLARIAVQPMPLAAVNFFCDVLACDPSVGTRALHCVHAA